MKNKKSMSAMFAVILLWMAWIFASCGRTEDTAESGGHFYYRATESEPAEPKTAAVEQESRDDLYLVLSNNSAEEMIQLYRYADGLQYRFYYGLQTDFLDKFGTFTDSSKFDSGSVVWLGKRDGSGVLEEIGKSDRVWEHSDVHRFAISQEGQTISIGNTAYTYGDDSYAFSGGEQVSLSDITEQDRLSVVGIDKRVLSIRVTTGHGTLKLVNTALFDGSYLQIDTKMFVKITENMSLDLAEGSYRIAVANNGWGGNLQIEVERGKTTEVDLETLKGDGPQLGTVRFSVDVEGAKLFIDNTEYAFQEDIVLQYGRHTLSVKVLDKEEWKRILYVNSKESVIDINLLQEDSDENTEKDDVTEPDSEGQNKQEETGSAPSKNSNFGHHAESKIGTGIGSRQGAENGKTGDKSKQGEGEDFLYKYLKDYLSTLSSGSEADL